MRWFWVPVVLVLALPIAGCADYSGTGNDFDIEATVASVGDESVIISPNNLTVNVQKGEADGYFHKEGGNITQNHLEVFDNYRTTNVEPDGRHVVGRAFDSDGNPIALKAVPVGRRVRLIGKLRSSRNGNGNDFRAVYDKLTVSP